MTEKNKGGRPPKQETLIARAVAASLAGVNAVGGMARKIKNKYDAAGMGRRLAGWNPTSSGPNRAIEGLQNIRNRSRDVTRNDWAGQAGIQKWTTNLIGIGITPRFKRIKDKARKQQLVDLWNDFVAAADADCVLDLYGMQTLAVRSWLESGEVFMRKRSRLPSAKLPLPVQLQLLEADMCPLLDTDSMDGLPTGNVIRSGIELDIRGRRVAYWFHKQHPGDKWNAANFDVSQLVRVAASEVVHMFEPLRPGQLRGVSMLAPVIVRLKNIGDYEDATLERQKLANLFVGFISRTLPPQTGDEDLDPLSGAELQYDDESTGAPLAGMTPGLMQELDDGQQVNWSNPPEAGTTYSDYMRTSHLGTAAASGLPYELFSGDIVNISDRTLRIIINDFRRHAEQRQWQIIIPSICQSAVDWFVEAAVFAGLVGVDEADDVRRVEHSPHGWQHIHPVQDPQGKKIEVESGFRSRASVIGERGDDPDYVDDEIASDDKRQQALKIGPYSKAQQQINNPPPPPPPPTPAPAAPTPAPAPAPAPKKALTTEDVRAVVEGEIEDEAFADGLLENLDA